MNFIKPFIGTLMCVIGIGILLMVVYKWVTSPMDEDETEITVASEPIPLADRLYGNEKDELIRKNKDYADELSDESYMLNHNIRAKEGAGTGTVTLTFAGDILFDEEYAVMATLQQNGGQLVNGISADLLQMMNDSDIMMINNEFPYSLQGSPTGGKQFTFRAHPNTVRYLDDMGVDIVSLANNHAYDYGPEALLDTLMVLDDAGINYIGAGGNIEEASRPIYYIVNNIKIGFVAATQIEQTDYPDTKEATETTPGVFRCWDGAKLLAQVKEARNECDFLVAFVHWGKENETELHWAEEKQARELADAGVDLIVGAHPHCLQKIDKMHGIPVVYSLGNFWFNSKTVDTGLLQVTMNREGIQKLQFIPAQQNNCRTSLLQGEEKQRVIGFMRSISPNVHIDDDGYVTW